MNRGQESENIAHSLRLGARQYPDRTALAMYGGETRSYAELAERSSRIANVLRTRGFAKGDRVAIWSETRIEYMDVYLACAQAGLVVAPVNARFRSREAAVILADSGARALFYSGGIEELVPGALDGVDVQMLVCFDRPQLARAQSLTALADGGEPAGRIDAGGHDLFILGYTSGTTGVPKGAMLTHAGVMNLGRTNALACRYVLGSVQVFALSMSFSATVPAHILPHLYVGGTTIMLPAWDTGQVIDAIEAHAANFLILPSPVVSDFTQAVEAGPGRVRSLVSVLHSASKVPAGLLQRLNTSLSGRLIEGWGMTENSGGLLTATTAQDTAADPGVALDTVGRAVPETEIAVLDEHGTKLPRDGRSVGQLAAKSYSLTTGYWGRPEATRTAFQEGWYLTGDMGTVDRSGHVRILDRRTDMINSGGMNIYPSEVEQVLQEIPGVQHAIVVPVPHPKWGQAPVAYVVGDMNLGKAQILTHCRQELAGYKRPLWIRFIDQLPLNTSGKVERQRLAALALEAETAASRG